MEYVKAQKLQAYAFEHARKNGNQIAVAIADAHGELVSFVRADGVSPHAAKLAQNKAYTAARDRQATSSLATWAQSTGKDLTYWSDSKFTGIAGGVPIVKGELLLGAIGISGMSEEQDHGLATSAAEHINSI